jgi:hypothetical protein
MRVHVARASGAKIALHDRRMQRLSESLGTDSLVLRLGKAVGASATASGA